MKLNCKLNSFRTAVQHERGPRNSTLRRQMSMFYSSMDSTVEMVKSSPTTSPSQSTSPDLHRSLHGDSTPPPSSSTGRASPSPSSGLTTPPASGGGLSFRPAPLMMMNFSSPPTPPHHHQQTPVSIPSLTPPSAGVFPYSALPALHHQHHHGHHHNAAVSAAEISHHLSLLAAAQQQQQIPRPINFFCAPQPKVKRKLISAKILIFMMD